MTVGATGRSPGYPCGGWAGDLPVAPTEPSARRVALSALAARRGQAQVAAQDALARQHDDDRGAGADVAGDRESAVVQFHHGLGQGDAEAGALVAARPGIVDLPEGREHLRHVLGGDADAGVDDANENVAVVVTAERELHLAAHRCELDGVRHQIHQYLPQLALVGAHAGGLLAAFPMERYAGDLGARGLLADHVGDHLAEIDLALRQPQLAALRLRIFEDVADQVQQMGAALVDVLGVLAIAFLAERPQQLALEHLREADDGVERRAQLVAHGGQEFGLGAAGALGLLHGFMQRARGAAEAQQEAGAVVEQRPVDRLGDEVGGAGLIGAVDRRYVIQPRDHEHGHVGAVRTLARLHAGGEAVDPRHHGVQEHQFRVQAVEQVERLQAVAGLMDGESRCLERLAHQQPMHDVVIGDENEGGIARFLVGNGHAVWRHFSFSSRSVSRSALLTFWNSVSMRTRRLSASTRSFWRARPSMSPICCANCFAPRLALLDFRLWAIFHTAEASPPATARRSSSSTVGAFSRYMPTARSSTDGPSPRRRLFR